MSDEERQRVHEYFENLNRTAGFHRRVRFDVVGWEEYSSAGVGRPQALITGQTLERFRPSLALVIVIMAQHFGSPSGGFESGTEEEARWALEAHRLSGQPEVKFFFRTIEAFVGSADAERDQLLAELDQWERVKGFRREIESGHAALVKGYGDAQAFDVVLRTDLDNWFHHASRPWMDPGPDEAGAPPVDVPDRPSAGYFEQLRRAYEWLDIAGIDSDRAFKLPLDQVYVRLRVIASQAAENADITTFHIQTALDRYRRLVIVGDPGTGKSTFLRFIALTLANAALGGSSSAGVTERLSMEPPFPVPVFVSCWDLAEHLRRVPRATLAAVVEFVAERVVETGWTLDRAVLERVLGAGECIVLIDGLDEVPTEAGRRLVSDLVEDLVRRYPENRYVVTSRIREYTGDTVLGQQFVRCDVQPFNKEERAAFLRNWVGQLVSSRSGSDGAVEEAAREFTALSEAVEASSIRDLADRPLLLTVIAIVHGNRKRLPEQRVDLYDECVDVLLGQRKEAEQQRVSRDTRAFDSEHGKQRIFQRAFVRKRFAEIAYAVRIRPREDKGRSAGLDRAAVLDLLERHFRADDADLARVKAEHFLDQQELRSGLLVRRGGSTYGFVHLTFEEYLAAWHLANRELDVVLDEIALYIREPTWFETLQLLGGALANRSDEGVDRYAGWLLERVGSTIQEQAPVIALVGNIVRDTQSITTLKPETAQRYEDLLQGTFAAFSPRSRVPKQTQLELLEALGDVGRSVKDQLVSATRSRLLDVRRRALEMLVPHLSDDDLFAMTHVLTDRSKEPVKTYLAALVERDRVRAGQVVLQREGHGEKTLEALSELPASPRLPGAGIEAWPWLLQRLRGAADWDSVVGLLDRWDDARDETRALIIALARAGTASAGHVLVRRWGDRADTWEVLRDQAVAGSEAALAILITQRAGDRATWDVVRERAAAHSSLAFDALAGRWDDRDAALAVVLGLARAGSAEAEVALAEGWGEQESTWEVLRSRAIAGSEAALRVLVAGRSGQWRTWEIVHDRAVVGSEAALQALVDRRSRDADTWQLVRSWAEAGSEVALQALLARADDHERCLGTRRTSGRAGRIAGIRLLLNHNVNRGGVWRLLAEVDDEAVARMCVEGSDRVIAEHIQWNGLEAGRVDVRVRRAARPPARRARRSSTDMSARCSVGWLRPARRRHWARSGGVSPDRGTGQAPR